MSLVILCITILLLSTAHADITKVNPNVLLKKDISIESSHTRVPSNECGDHLIYQIKCHLFKNTHPDFKCRLPYKNHTPNIIESHLNQCRPVLNSSFMGNRPNCISTVDNFDGWYNNTEEDYVNDAEFDERGLQHHFDRDDVNEQVNETVRDYYPGKKEGRSQNPYFTCRAHMCFIHSTKRSFTINTNNEVWIFINDTLVLDAGGIHGHLHNRLDMDTLNLTVGQPYRLNLFIGQRSSSHATMAVHSNICFFLCKDCEVSMPTVTPTISIIVPTDNPSLAPTTGTPTSTPTNSPTIEPTNTPSNTPTTTTTIEPTSIPTFVPTELPSTQPTTMTRLLPIIRPTNTPSGTPTTGPTITELPSVQPTSIHTSGPTNGPTVTPTSIPTTQPTNILTSSPTHAPTNGPTISPTTQSPTLGYTGHPTEQPTYIHTSEPTNGPTELSTANPTKYPTIQPTVAPTNNPTSMPTNVHTVAPTNEPTLVPTSRHIEHPTRQPTTQSTPTISHRPYCGNNITEYTEECDNGIANNNLYGTCMENCKRPVCGDGVIHLCHIPTIDCVGNECASLDCIPEECDDGNLIDGDGCSSSCRYEHIDC